MTNYCFRIITYLDVTPSILFFLLDRICRIIRILFCLSTFPASGSGKDMGVRPMGNGGRGQLVNLLDTINRILKMFLLYLEFPEEIPNEQSAPPRRNLSMTKCVVMGSRRNGGRWKVCKVIYVPIPGWHNRHIMSYPLLQPRERSFV